MDEDEDLKELFGSNEEIDIYLSYSRVADFSKNGPKVLLQKTNVNNEGAKIGSITDDWLFNKDSFFNIYKIYDGEKPTAMLGKLVDIILKNYTIIPDKETILDIVKNNEFWKRSSDEVLYTKFDIPEFWEYLNAYIDITTKTIITSSQFELGKVLSEVLLTHEFSKDIFSDRFTRINQYKFDISYKNIKFRGIIDMILIDHEYKTIRLVDLKTGLPHSDEFMTSFLKYRYYFQEAVYMLAISEIKKELGIEDYSILPFQFLYIGRTEQLPIIFDVTQKWHDAALNGFTSTGGYHYKGLDETLDEIIWHFKHREFELSKSVYENNGNIDLNDNFFTINN